MKTISSNTLKNKRHKRLVQILPKTKKSHQIFGFMRGQLIINGDLTKPLKELWHAEK
jgi:hypothetical protein